MYVFKLVAVFFLSAFMFTTAGTKWQYVYTEAVQLSDRYLIVVVLLTLGF